MIGETMIPNGTGSVKYVTIGMMPAKNVVVPEIRAA
jgi:hypothetical protein